jgi:hypothetical protein
LNKNIFPSKENKSKNFKTNLSVSFLEIKRDVKKEQKIDILEREDKRDSCTKYKDFKSEFLKTIHTDLEHEIKTIVTLHETPINFFNLIIEDKERCISDFNHRTCVTLDYRIELFNKVLYEFIDSKNDSLTECEKNKNSIRRKFDDLLNYLVICKLGKEANNTDYNPTCENLSHSKQILFLELHKLKDKTLSQKFEKFTIKSQECLIKDCQSSSSFSTEIKYEEEIKKYKKKIEELTKKKPLR